MGAEGRRALIVVIDTNIIVSALISPQSAPRRILDHWRKGRFVMLTCVEQVDELRRATRYPKIRSQVKPAVVGALINEIGKAGRQIAKLPRVDRSPDPFDNYLLALAEAGGADYLVTGDKVGLAHPWQTRLDEIVSVRTFAGVLAWILFWRARISAGCW